MRSRRDTIQKRAWEMGLLPIFCRRSSLVIGLWLTLIFVVSSMGCELQADESPSDRSNASLLAAARAATKGRLKTLRLAKTLILKKVDLTNVTIVEAAEYLTKETKKDAPDHHGINFTAHVRPEFLQHSITLNLENVTLKEVLEQIGKQTILSYDAGNSIIDFRYDSGEGIYSRTFILPAGYFRISPEHLIDKAKRTYDVAEQLEPKGIQFPPGNSAVYEPEKNRLMVVGSEQLVDRVEVLINDPAESDPNETNF